MIRISYIYIIENQLINYLYIKKKINNFCAI